MVLLYMGILSCACAAAEQVPKNDVASTRIVSLVPNLTEILFGIGAGGQIVGVSDFCRYPVEAQSRPAVGGLVNPSLEKVLQLRPTLVLAFRSQQDFAIKLNQLGIRAELFQVDTLNDLYKAISRLGIETGQTSSAAVLASDIRERLQNISNKAEALPRRVRGIVVVSRDPAGLRAIYQGTFLSELFKMAGGELAIPDGAAISVEDIIRANPQIIIDVSSSEEEGSKSASSPEKFVGPWAQLSTVDAVKSGNVYRWSNRHVLLLGPSIMSSIEVLHRLIQQTLQAE